MLIVLEPCDSSTCSWKIYHMLPGGGGGCSNDGDDRMGAKIKTQNKFLGLLTKPPQKIPCRTTQHYHDSSDCFESPQKSLLKSSHPKKELPNFPTQKNPRIEHFKPQKILRSSSSLAEITEDHPSADHVGTASTGASTCDNTRSQSEEYETIAALLERMASLEMKVCYFEEN